MKLQLEGREADVRVYHTLQEQKLPIPNTRDAMAVGFTTAYVRTSEGSLFTGQAWCSDSEREFRPDQGRKLALARAIKGWPKERRAIFWRALREQEGWVW